MRRHHPASRALRNFESEIESGRFASLSSTFRRSNVRTFPRSLTYLLSFHTLPHSFALTKNTTLLFSVNSALFSKNTRGWGALQPSRALRLAEYLSPFLENHSETETANTAVSSIRCAHRTPGGRQCRLPVSDPRSGLCPQHRAAQQQIEAADHYLHLTTKFQYFQAAQGINFSLGNLYQLLAQNRISPRRAAVLAYINSLLLRTLPQIDADNAAGIKFPPKTLTIANAAPVPDKDAGLVEEVNLDEVVDLDSASHSGADSASNAESDSKHDSDSEPEPVSANAWPPSIPEPDPHKKPS